MNVLLLTTYPHGGAGVACRRLQTALRAQGHTAQVLTQPEVGGRSAFIAERLSFLPWERDRSVRFEYSLANFGTDLSRHPAVQAADVLHLHWINQGFLSLRQLARLGTLGKPIVWTMHDMWPFTGGCHHARQCTRYTHACGQCPYLRWPADGDLSNRVWRRKQRFFPKKMHFVACSEWLATCARQSSLLADYPIAVIPNPIDTEAFAPPTAADRAAFRHQIGAAPDTRLLLFAAMSISNPRKGFDYLRSALHVLRQRRPDLAVAVVAIGKSQPGELDGLPYPVHDLGLVRDAALMARTYGSVDAFVTPSLEENLPNTIMESMACGTPAVGFRVGGIPEMIGDHQHGRVTPLRDADALADALAWVLDDEPRRLALGHAARQKVLDTYAQDRVAARYLEVYERSNPIPTPSPAGEGVFFFFEKKCPPWRGSS
jgi:glycosyltransferase involved in cell wall biosynthesis